MPDVETYAQSLKREDMRCEKKKRNLACPLSTAAFRRIVCRCWCSSRKDRILTQENSKRYAILVCMVATTSSSRGLTSCCDLKRRESFTSNSCFLYRPLASTTRTHLTTGFFLHCPWSLTSPTIRRCPRNSLVLMTQASPTHQD